VAAALRDDGHDVVVTGGAQECALAREVACAAGLDRASVLAGHLDLSALAALVSTSRLVLSGDTGIAHLATAYRSPSVVLFGPTPPALWGPPQRAQHRVIWHGKCTLQDPASHGVGDAVHPALLAVTVPEVLDAINELLDALKRLPVLG
jgi:ADP-heptose:LPS heptosyltransferase